MSSSIRFDGLISGMDTATMIDQLMAVERRPLQSLQDHQSSVKAQKSLWQDLATRMQSLQSAVSSLLKASTLSGHTVTFPTPSSVLSATAGGSAVNGSYQVLVSQLATSTVMRSTAPIGADVVTGDPLATANFSTPVTAGTFSINGVQVSVDPATDSLDDVIARINSAGAGVVASTTMVDGRTRLTLNAATAGGPLQLGSTGDTSNFLAATGVLAAPRAGDSVTGTRALGAVDTSVALQDAHLATPLSGAGTLTINNVDIQYDAATDFLSTIINRINASAAGVTASYDPTTDRFQIVSKQTGSMAIGLSDTGGFLSAMSLTDPAARTLGQNAAYSLDGGATMRYSTSNTVSDAIPGVTLTLSGTSATPVQFTVQPDADGAVDAVKAFVEQVNSVLGFIADKSAYNATTKTAGPLAGDPSARSLAAALRQKLISPSGDPSGTYQLLSQIGISFGSIGSAVGSTDKLQVDETKLRAALQDNPQAVLDLVAGPSGVLTGLNSYLTDTLGPDGVFKIRDTGADTELRRLDQQVRALQDRLDMKEERLTRQFAEMESVLARLQAQSQALANQLLGLTNSANG